MTPEKIKQLTPDGYGGDFEMTDTNQASEDELAIIEKIIRFNCPMSCDGNGSYPEMSADGEWEQGQCQWCFEYGMPARDAIQSLIRTEKLKLLAEVRERVVGAKNDLCFTNKMPQTLPEYVDDVVKVREQLRVEQREVLTKLEAEL